MNEIAILINEGKLEQAKTRLAHELRQSANPEHHDRYHKLLLLSNGGNELLRHGKEYLSILKHNGRISRAAEVYRDLVQKKPEFRHSDGNLTYEVAQAAFRNGNRSLALQLLSGFNRQYPAHERIPDAYFLAAKILCEHQNNDVKAKEILQSLIKHYPEHALTPEIKEYLNLIDRLQGSGTANQPV